MNFGFLRRCTTASVARERLKVLLAHERTFRGGPNLIAVLKHEILTAITKHVRLEPDSVQVRMDRGEGVTMLEIDVEISNASPATPVTRRLLRNTSNQGSSVRPCTSSL
jgi:cell division topological specificity factor